MSVSGVTGQSPIPTTGMRGGLGRTLLTAFLALAIVPLSAISWYTTVRERINIQQEVTARLSSIATMTEARIDQWTERRAAYLAFLAALPTTVQNVSVLVHHPSASDGVPISRQNTTETPTPHSALYAQLQALRSQDPALRRVAILDSAGDVLVTTDPQIEGTQMEHLLSADSKSGPVLPPVSLDPAAGGLVIAQRIADSNGQTLGLLVGWFDPQDLAADLQMIPQQVHTLGATGEIYLVDANGVALPQGRVVSSPAIEAALAGEETEGLQENYAGIPTIGVYRRLPRLGVVLVAEQTQEEAFAETEQITITVVGAPIVVALATAVIAAVVTRQITQPIVRLTKSALSIAEGDLDQRVPVTSRDEIGILAYVFNRMATELKTLYQDLESKVVQRTALLQSANYQIQRRAIQMQASLEVGQAVTSILDPDQLLNQVVKVVRSRFVYSHVAVYTTNGDGNRLRLRASAGEPTTFHGDMVSVDMPGPVGRAFREGEAVVETRPVSIKVGPPTSYISSEAALPLRLGDRTLGVLNVQSTDEEGLDQDDVSVLQNVANQISIALGNARAYTLERDAAEQLRELDLSKRRFLANMSHELRTPLTNIIGFSRLMLKGINGPLTEQQASDLQIIYQDSQHLLGLINDLLDISHIEAGLMELDFQEVDLAKLIHSVMATASALVRDKDVELNLDIPPDLPPVRADNARIRQVLLRLLANAAKFTDHGTITVQARRDDGRVLISVKDTGIGIPPKDRERIFQRFEQGTLENGRRPEGAGLGLALSKEFVEMHGGAIWVESEVGQGSTFTFSLPLPPTSSQDPAPES